MADANKKKYQTWIKNFTFARREGGGEPTIVWVTAGAALSKGVPVYMSGNFAQAVSGSATTLGIYGITMKAAAASGASIPVIAAGKDTIFVGQLSAVPAGTFVNYPHKCDFTGTTSVSVLATASTNNLLTALRPVPGDNTADTVYFGRVEFLINTSQYESGVEM